MVERLVVVDLSRGISIITAVGIGRLVSPKPNSRAWRDGSDVQPLFDEDLDEQMARWAQLDAQGFGGPPDAEEDPEEDLEEVVAEDTEKDPEEDSMGTDDYVPRGYTLELRDPKDFDPWDESASD
ncbi:hypothetical protein FNV43_RR21243 [Rhamnella rubrinervis]|uniref:Uncharacterized protein n=1 Tax=Rhamnella rubrinervis TaxID=2594499 RepID=A0A8K0E1C1_9ROSA|nr:hypothetical protein FNV43_RR21243 [Rhamnella rubrinervis]